MADDQGGSGFVVLLRGFDGGMTEEILADNLRSLHGVTVAVDELDSTVEAFGAMPDLVIEPMEGLAPPSASILVSETGECVATIPLEQLTEATIALAVNAIRTDHRPWLETVVEACRRIDDLLERAVVLAETLYRDGEGYVDWRSAFTANRPLAPGSPAAGPLESPIGSPSAEAAPFLARLGDSWFTGRDAFTRNEHPFAELVRRYRLNGRHIDTLLLCFANELDPRYGRRFAYLQQDPHQTAPTIDLVAALLGTSPSDRLQIQRDFLDGRLVRSGLIVLSHPGLATPLREATLGLDPAVAKMLLGDAAPSADQVLVRPERTARASVEYAPSVVAATAIDQLDGGEQLHIYSSDKDARRSLALDLAYARHRRLLILAGSDLAPPAPDGQPASSRIDAAGIERLHRELIRLGAMAFVDDVPPGSSALIDALDRLSATVITGGAAPLGSLIRKDVPLASMRAEDRARVWRCAEDWTGISVVGGAERLQGRFSVSVDKASDALRSAAHHSSPNEAHAGAVADRLTASANDDAGGLLRTSHSAVTLADLVVDDKTMADLRYACARIRNRDAVILEQGWNARSERLTGTYLLLAGPSGTGKTMAAEAIAGELGLPVQHLELSSLLSRWVGEFEASVDKVFSAAEASGGIVVMNEADAVLAPRTDSDSVQARYSNASTSHLLSRLEQFRGHAIFTTNLVGADSIDAAFHRRLTATIRFRLPDCDQRFALWQSVWPKETVSGDTVSYTIHGQAPAESSCLHALAVAHPLSGGSIANVARTAAFLASDRRGADELGGNSALEIDEATLKEALRLELDKIGDFRLLLASGGLRP